MPTTDQPERRPSPQGRMLRKYRDANGLTYAELRERMRERMNGYAVSEATLKNLERGVTQRPYIKQRKAISVAVGWDHDMTWAD